MPILVKACRTCPVNASVRRRTVSPSHRLVQQLIQGSFGPFPVCLNPKLRCFEPKSSDFSQFKPRNIIKTYPSQIIKSKHRKLEASEEKKAQEPKFKNATSSSSSNLETWVFWRGFHHQVCGISLVDFFHPLGPLFSISSWFSFHY